MDRGCFGRSVSRQCCVLGGQSLEFWFWRSKRLDSKSPGLGSRKPQKPGPLGGVGVGCRLRRVIRFYRTLTTVWTCEAKKPRWPKYLCESIYQNIELNIKCDVSFNCLRYHFLFFSYTLVSRYGLRYLRQGPKNTQKGGRLPFFCRRSTPKTLFFCAVFQAKNRKKGVFFWSLPALG